MKPIFTVASLQVTPYSLMIFAGALMGVLLSVRKKEIRPLLPGVILGAIIMGHILWTMFCSDAYYEGSSRLLLALQPWKGGYTLYGAIFGGALAGLIGAKLLKVNGLDVLDALAPGVCAVLMMGRLGEYFTDQGFGEVVEEGQEFFPLAYCTYQDEYYQEWHYAIWFWEAVVALILLVLLLCRAKKAKRGEQILLFAVGLSCTQMVLEQMRRDDFVCVTIFIRVTQLAALATLIGILAVQFFRYPSSGLWKGLSIASLAAGALAVMCVEFAFDKPQFYIWLYLSMGATALLLVALLWRRCGIGGILKGSPLWLLILVLTSIHIARQEEDLTTLLYLMMAAASAAIGMTVYLNHFGRKEAQAV